ncbi:MscL family protein, partial [Bacillus altitudinis]|uniref:MscL family protein n=1 Tax=Bacillus altitudinis TaxID=293387 RepID=UPI001C92DCBB
MLKQFTHFPLNPNLIHLPLPLIIPPAFPKILTSLLNHLIIPLLPIILRAHHFTRLSIKIASPQILYPTF